MKHTPGPWEVDQGGNVFGCRLRRLVASTMGHSSNINFEAIQDENIANSKLISAAPELYEALKDAMKVAEFEQHAERPWHHKAREAIAKAEGNQ